MLSFLAAMWEHIWSVIAFPFTLSRANALDLDGANDWELDGTALAALTRAETNAMLDSAHPSPYPFCSDDEGTQDAPEAQAPDSGAGSSPPAYGPAPDSDRDSDDAQVAGTVRAQVSPRIVLSVSHNGPPPPDSMEDAREEGIEYAFDYVFDAPVGNGAFELTGYDADVLGDALADDTELTAIREDGDGGEEGDFGDGRELDAAV